MSTSAASSRPITVVEAPHYRVGFKSPHPVHRRLGSRPLLRQMSNWHETYNSLCHQNDQRSVLYPFPPERRRVAQYVQCHRILGRFGACEGL